jgi:hypothetical protein
VPETVPLDPLHGIVTLRRFAQELLDRWYPGTLVHADWTGTVFVVQLARGYRLADPIWVTADCLDAPEQEIRLTYELVLAAWHLAQRH